MYNFVRLDDVAIIDLVVVNTFLIFTLFEKSISFLKLLFILYKKSIWLSLHNKSE